VKTVHGLSQDDNPSLLNLCHAHAKLNSIGVQGKLKKEAKNSEPIGVVIVAAGTSQRMNGRDKILALLAGKPVILHALEPFLKLPDVGRIVVVLNRRNIRAVKDLLEEHELNERVVTCLGGKRRQDSVLTGLKKLSSCDWVIIQDGARPNISVDIIKRGLDAVQDTGAAVAAVPVSDTIKLADEDMFVRWTMPRENLWQIQTPQVFFYDTLMDAFACSNEDVTDEAMLIELAGGTVKLFMGTYDNIKITTPEDLVIAKTLMRNRKKKA
jgi:2-C-methyl-D-erythritol 4-phosphate cytidylyltransferase